MSKVKPGYVKFGEEWRYQDEDGKMYHNHLGPALNQIGNLFNNPTIQPTSKGHLLNKDGSIGITKSKPTIQNIQQPSGKGSVVRIGGKEYRMDVPAEKAEYERIQKAELDRQRGKSPFSDQRGGDGLLSTGKRASDNRTNANGISQKGRNFDSMARDIFDAMAKRNANTGVTASTLAAINRMNPESKFSSTNLPVTGTNVFTNTEGSTNSFENPGIAVNTGSVQPRETNVNFSSAGATQFKNPDDMPSVITNPGPKNPVEYTNYMTRDDALSAMDALQMNEKQKGLIYASGQYWGEGADGKAVQVDRDLARKVKRGAEGADELLANFLGRGGLAAAADSVVEPGTDYKPTDYDSQGNLLNDSNLITFKDGSTRYLSDIPEDEDLSATY